MCHNHRTVHLPCHHVHEHITLCLLSVLPLVRRASQYNYTLPLQMPPQHPAFGDPNHDVLLTGGTSEEPCRACRRAERASHKEDEALKDTGELTDKELDIWHLDESLKKEENRWVKNLGYEISVEVEGSKGVGGFGGVVMDKGNLAGIQPAGVEMRNDQGKLAGDSWLLGLQGTSMEEGKLASDVRVLVELSLKAIRGHMVPAKRGASKL
jgi:hypothetical protein